ncbi:FtsX-like permease family protein [Clostridium pasteurianum]|uniref:ABC-type transport system, involved in lipoprotein release, permease component n=1 Tax=Clostridium pasteurianum BC1 TaxID=86416 RepID=R4K4K0_CLOPA|nr:ABC transporter permease [Clostridium pasteurianum]AGK98077.1 ABC-type transport system, involved in lipoprotein release, permease component [Clostridium pasteurianum BC1]
MKPLSIITYLKNNKRKVLPGFVCIVLSVFLVYFFSILLYSTIYAIQLGSINVVDKVTIVNSTNKNSISDKILNKISTSKDVKDIIPIIGDVGYFEYHSPFGSMSVEGYNVFSEDIPKLLNIFNMKLQQGTNPADNKNEIIISLKYAKQNKIKIGDYIGTNPDLRANFNKKYRVSGIIDGPVNIAFTSNSGSIKREDALKYSLMFSMNDRRINDEIMDMGDKNVNIVDYKSAVTEVNQIIESMNALGIILDTIIIIVLCISIGNLNYVVFLNRKNEFSILTAIGYRKIALYRKLLMENLAVNILGYILGIAFTILVVEILNITVWEPNGQYIYSLRTGSMITALLVPIFVSVISMISPLRELKAMDYECINI